MSDGSQSSSPCTKCRKVFNDAVHGSIELPLLCVKIINTPEFQRLRLVKQIGPSYFLYPAASHNRFEHSLGVSYLAGRFAEQLKREQPELAISEEDVLCVQVAGLCHDLGHGPFSHTWQDYMKKHQLHWKHEDASAAMLDHLLTANSIDVTEYGLEGENDVTFIKELICNDKKFTGSADWNNIYRGRPYEKAFLYQIVANSENDVDVDKFDYFLRDSHNLGLSVTFNYKRLMQHSRVVEVPETKLRTICWRDKEVESVIELFSNRYQLHRKAYKHRICQLLNVMILDVFLKAESHLKYRGSDRKLYSLSEVVNNMAAYSQLTDDVLMQVTRLESNDNEIKEAQEIVRRILSRELYETVGSVSPSQIQGDKKVEEMVEDFKNVMKIMIELHSHKLEPLHMKAMDSFDVYGTVLNFGHGEKSPLDRIWFYSKNDPSKPFKIDGDKVSSTMIPRSFQEVTVTVISRSCDELVIKVLKDAFKDACRVHGWRESEGERDPKRQCIHSIATPAPVAAAAPAPVAAAAPTLVFRAAHHSNLYLAH